MAPAPLLPRHQFPVAERYRYLNHALVAPLPLVAVEAMAADSRRCAEDASVAFPEREAHMEEVRSRAAALMGVAADDMAFVKNTTEGLAFVAGGIDWGPDDRVVVR